jgi:hypothetical protein
MNRLLAALVAGLLCTASYAQNAGTVANHAFAIGKGPGVTGYTSLLCASGQLAVGQATDPICRTVSGDGTLSAAGVLALATVNANVGAFGSATNCPTVTLDGKGRTTAAAQTACTPAIGNITGLGTGVATALGVNIGSAGAPVLFNGVGGTPASIVLTNATGLPRAGMVNGVARSVIGVTGNAAAAPADIQGTADQVLVVNSAGTALGFGQVNLAAAAATTGVSPIVRGGTGVATGAVLRVVSQVFTASGTYTPTTGTLYSTLRCWGAGAGGGGVTNSGATTSFAAAGGGAGSPAEDTLSAAAIGASLTVTIGAAGTAGANTGAAGGNGGDSCFTTSTCVSGQKVAGKGGTGGSGATGTGVSVGGAGGVAGTGGVVGTGQRGSNGYGSTNTAAIPSFFSGGGTSALGGGPQGSMIAQQTVGVDGTGRGSGGGGAVSWAAAGAAIGGAGTAGECVATDFVNQ